MAKNPIQWFPGHMAKTRRMISENLKNVDVVIEILDARIPLASRNPEIEEITSSKPRIILLNKCDMADKTVTEEWIKYYKMEQRQSSSSVPYRNCRKCFRQRQYLK